jgi:nitrate reductase assembly molybdenum cofactor insertion protein NarJ
MGKWYFDMLPEILSAVSRYLRLRDKDNVGRDDDGARLLIDFAPVTEALTAGTSDSGYYRAVRALRETCDNILAREPRTEGEG